MSWRDRIVQLLVGRAPVAAETAPRMYDPRVNSLLQFDNSVGGRRVGDEMPVGWPANTNINRPPADVLPFDDPLRPPR